MQVSPTQMGAVGSVQSSELVQPVGPDSELEAVPSDVPVIESVAAVVAVDDDGPEVRVVPSVVVAESLAVEVPATSQSGSSCSDVRSPHAE
ncbi:MAG: hypothetical protein U0168_29105 [Nannocystaceae bacterium]